MSWSAVKANVEKMNDRTIFNMRGIRESSAA